MYIFVHVVGQNVGCITVTFAFSARLEEHIYDFPECRVYLHISILTLKCEKENYFNPKCF